jgi:hypothetical protein
MSPNRKGIAVTGGDFFARENRWQRFNPAHLELPPQLPVPPHLEMLAVESP